MESELRQHTPQKSCLFPRSSKYHWSIYVIAALLVSLQFLQIHRASGFFFDDLFFLVAYRSYSLSRYIADWSLWSTPNYWLFIHILAVFGEPLLCHLFILGVFLLGSLVFVHIASLFGLHWLLTLLVLNLAVSFPFAAQPVYYVTSFHFAFAWTFALIAFALFLHCPNLSAWRHRVLFVLSIFAYWMSVTITPQLALLPLITLPMALTPLVYDPKAHPGAIEGAKSLADYIKTYVHQYRRSLFLCLLFILLTTGAFLVRQFVFAMRYHYYEWGMVDYSLQQVLKGLGTFLFRVVRSFKLGALMNLTLPPLEFSFSVIGILAIYSACFMRYARNTSALVREVSKTESFRFRCWIALLFLLLAILTVFPVTLIISLQDRYFLAPGVFLTASVLIFLSALIDFFFGRSSRYNMVLGFWFLLLLASVTLSTYNRYLHIEGGYIAKATIYQEFKKIIERDIDIARLPPGTQVVILDHNASELTSGYENGSAGLLKLTTGRDDLSGLVTRSHWDSDPFSSKIYGRRGGRTLRKKAAGLVKDKPLIMYRYTSGGVLAPVHYLTLKEGKKWNLYELTSTPKLIRSTDKVNKIMEILKSEGIALADVWQAKPYPDGYFGQENESWRNIKPE